MDQVQNEVIAAKLTHLSAVAADTSTDNLHAQILAGTPELYGEVTSLMSVAAEIPSMPGSGRYDENVIAFLRNSSLISDLISSYSVMIIHTVKEVLNRKAVGRVCEVGDPSAIFTKMMVQALEDEIESAKVDYTQIQRDK